MKDPIVVLKAVAPLTVALARAMAYLAGRPAECIKAVFTFA